MAATLKDVTDYINAQAMAFLDGAGNAQKYTSQQIDSLQSNLAQVSAALNSVATKNNLVVLDQRTGGQHATATQDLVRDYKNKELKTLGKL